MFLINMSLVRWWIASKKIFFLHFIFLSECVESPLTWIAAKHCDCNMQLQKCNACIGTFQQIKSVIVLNCLHNTVIWVLAFLHGLFCLQLLYPEVWTLYLSFLNLRLLIFNLVICHILYFINSLFYVSSMVLGLLAWLSILCLIRTPLKELSTGIMISL